MSYEDDEERQIQVLNKGMSAAWESSLVTQKKI
jgi:hypothetical protein